MKILKPLFDFLKKEILKIPSLQKRIVRRSSILQPCFLLFFTSITATAQQYPVDCRISIIPPYANRFFDYQNSPQRFKVTLLLRDHTKPTLDVVLQIRLKGPGFIIENPGDFLTAQPITLSPGRPQTLSGLELSDNFNPANLETQGIELADLFTGVGLPPGPYEWEVRAFELYRDRQVSNTASFRMNLALNYPPLLNQPAQKAQLSPMQPQSINFSWMPRPSASLAAKQGLLYTLMLYEVPPGEDPNAVVNSGAAPFRVIETGQTNYFYGPMEVPMEVGKTYAWQVQVSDINGQETYVNNGYSEVHTFTYGQNTCPTPTNVQVSVADDGAVNFTWDSVPEASSYTLRYRPDPSTNSGPAVNYKTKILNEPEYLLLYQAAGRSYQYQLGTTCQYSGSSPYTPWETFEIPAEGDELYPEDTMAYISDPELSYEPEIFEQDVTQLSPPEADEPSIEDLLNTPIKIYIPADENATEPPVSVPTTPQNLNEKEIKNLLNSKKPTCAGIVSSYSCGNHDTAPMYSGALVSVATGDEVAINSLVISIVDIDDGGNGSGKIKIPMFQNAEVGVTLSGIKVAEGGCIIEGKAELSGVDIALLNEQQRAKLAIAYDIFVEATDAVYNHAEVISETYNSIADLYQGIAKKTQNLIDKLNNGQKITKRETKELEELKKQAADKMKKSADYFLKSLRNEGAQPILDLIKAANESCVCDLETEEVKKGPFYDDIFVNLDDCKKCLEEQKKKQEQAALLAKAFEKRYKSMKNKEMTCGCLSWGNFLQDISIIDGLTDCEEIVSIMNKAKADLSNIGSADFSVNNLFFDENKPTGQVSIGNTCIDNFSLKANPNSASIVVNRDKKTQYNDPAVEISSNNITITDYSNPGNNLVIGTDDNEQARLVEKWLFDKILNVAKSSKNTDYTPPEGAVDVSLLNISEKGKETLSKHEGGCILHVYNDYKGAKSDFCKEHFNKGKVIEDHKDNAKWIGDKCETQNHYAEIKRLSIKGYGNPTIGVGYMISNHSELEKFSIEKENKITKEECLKLFSDKLPGYIDDLKAAIPNGSKLTQCQFDALVSIVYNRGIGRENCKAGPGKCGFKSDEFYKKIILEKKFNASEAYDLILNDHSKLKGGDRRKAEAELYTNCKY